MSEYRKLVADGVAVDAYKGSLPKRLSRLLHFRGCHIEIATKEEYESFRVKRKPAVSTEDKQISMF